LLGKDQGESQRLARGFQQIAAKMATKWQKKDAIVNATIFSDVETILAGRIKRSRGIVCLPMGLAAVAEKWLFTER